MIINDAHCHFFSRGFFTALGRQRVSDPQPADDVIRTLGWDDPVSDEALADRWVQELDANGVRRAVMIASVPRDEGAVANAVARHPSRIVGFFMLDPTEAAAPSRVECAMHELKLSGVCLFPAMHRYSLHDASVRAIVEYVARNRSSSPMAVFVHCGALSVGVRQKLGLPSRFDVRRGNPLDVHALAADHPEVPFIVPHFGAGLLREALMLADLCQNVYLDTSSSNKWMAYHPGLALDAVLRQTVATIGAERLLFGTDSSCFPRGWHRAVYDQQVNASHVAGLDDAARTAIFGGNFDRLFPLQC